jgi:predicted DNA-binding transcriptional regulator AlpA
VPDPTLKGSNLVRELQLHGPLESTTCEPPSAQLGQVGAQLSQRPASPVRASLDPLLTVEQAAAYLGLSAKWVYRNYKRLTPILIGDGPRPRIRFRRSDLDAWIFRHRIQ